MASVKDDNFAKEEDKVQASVAESFNTGAGRAQQAQASAASAQKAKRQGSGQATNIQKYIKANQGAGKEIAGDIAEKGKGQAEDISSRVNAAQNVYNQRAGQLQQNINQAQQSGQNVFNQAGQGQSPNMSSQIAQAGQLAQGTLGNRATGLGVGTSDIQSRIGAIQGLTQQVGTEGGRFQALSDLYKQGGRNYNTGQQRLDQLLLQRGGAQDLQGQLSGMADQSQQALAGLQSSTEATKSGLIQDATAKQQSLRNLIQTGSAEGLEDNLQQRGLEDIMAGTQGRAEAETARRAQERAAYDTLASKLRSGEGLSAEEYAMADKLGVKQGTRTYDAFGPESKYLGDNFGAESFGQFGASDVGYKNVANQQEVDRYNALAQIVKQDPSQFATEAGTLDQSFTGGTGLSDIINKAKADFDTNAASANITGTGTGHRSTGKSWTGQVKHFTGDASASQNIADYLAGKESNNQGAVGTNARGFLDSTAANITDALSHLVTGGDAAGRRRETSYKQQAQAEAEKKAQVDLQEKINKYLEDSGYNRKF